MRARAAIGLLALVAVAVAGCSTPEPATESLDTAIPAAFLASDLGITGAQAGTSMSGTSLSVWASAEFETDAVTADDLRAMLQLAVDNTGRDDIDRLKILATVGPFQDDVAIDLEALGAELGFTDDRDGLPSFEARWDDVVAYLDT